MTDQLNCKMVIAEHKHRGPVRWHRSATPVKLVLPIPLEFHRPSGLRREREPRPDGVETGEAP